MAHCDIGFVAYTSFTAMIRATEEREICDVKPYLTDNEYSVTLSTTAELVNNLQMGD